MTDDDLRKQPEFGELPIYDETDDRSRDLLCPYDIQYDGTISEAEDDLHFFRLLQDPQYNVKGAIRYASRDVRPVFWRRKS